MLNILSPLSSLSAFPPPFILQFRDFPPPTLHSHHEHAWIQHNNIANQLVSSALARVFHVYTWATLRLLARTRDKSPRGSISLSFPFFSFCSSPPAVGIRVYSLSSCTRIERMEKSFALIVPLSVGGKGFFFFYERWNGDLIRDFARMPLAVLCAGFAWSRRWKWSCATGLIVVKRRVCAYIYIDTNAHALFISAFCYSVNCSNEA